MSKIKVDTIETLDGSKSFNVADLSDATYPIEDVLTSTNTNSALSANQGRVLKGLVDGKSATSHTHGNATTSSAGFFSASDKTKLDGVATGATANSSDATLKDRANHTGTQAISTVSGLQAALDAKAPLTAISITDSLPTIRPSLLLDFANSKQVDPRIAFTRASAATYFDAQGVLRIAASGVPRIDHDPVTGECKGLLTEEARTNLLTYSEQFDNAAWVKTRSSIVANAAVAPDGTMTADKLVEDTSVNLTHQIGQTTTITASATYAFTVFVKSVERAQCQLVLSVGSDSISADYDITAATATNRANAGSGVIASSSITPVGNDWFRVSIIGVVSAAGGSGSALFRLRSGGTNSYTGDGTSGLYVWGAQLELGAFATSVIPTTSAAATRAADVASMSGANFSEWYRQDEGTFVVGFGAPNIPSDTATYGRVYSAHGGTNANSIDVLINGGWTPDRIVAIINVGGVASFDSAGTANGWVATPVSYAVNATAYKADSFATSWNGLAAVTDSAGALPVVNQLNIGCYLSDSQLNGHIKRIAYYPKRLTNAELQAITTQ